MEDAVDGKGQEGERGLAGEEPDEGHDCESYPSAVTPQSDDICVKIVRRTQILHVLIPSQLQRGAMPLPTLRTCTVAFEDHDAVGGGGGDKGGAVAVAGPAAGRVEGDVAQAVAEGADEEGDMPAEPGELEAGWYVSTGACVWVVAGRDWENIRLSEPHQARLEGLGGGGSGSHLAVCCSLRDPVCVWVTLLIWLLVGKTRIGLVN